MFLLTCGVQEEGQYYRHVKHDLTAGWEHSGLVRVLECKQWELWFAEVNTPFFPTPPFFAFSYAWMSRDTVKAQGAKDFQPAHSLSLSPALCLLRPPVSLAFFVKANKTLQSRRLGQKKFKKKKLHACSVHFSGLRPRRSCGVPFPELPFWIKPVSSAFCSADCQIV